MIYTRDILLQTASFIPTLNDCDGNEEGFGWRVLHVVLLVIFISFATMPTRSASLTSKKSSSSSTSSIEGYANSTVNSCAIHGTFSPSAQKTENYLPEVELEDLHKNKGTDTTSLIPLSFDAPFGSYPNLLKITNDERKSFSPVVFFPETRRNSDSKNDVVVKDHRGSNGELASIEAIERKRALKQKSFRGWFWTLSANTVSMLVQNVIRAVMRRLGSKTFSVEDDQLLSQQQQQQWAIGKYDENRDGGMYESDLFDDLENTIDRYGGRRTVHLGMDLGGPVGTPVHAFSDGIVHSVGYNPQLGDYGYAIVVEHFWGDDSSSEDRNKAKNNSNKRCWALYGHLDESTLTSSVAIGEGDSQPKNRWLTSLLSPRSKPTCLVKAGDFVRKGAILGRMGDIDENGGWIKPHLHFQLSTKPPDQPHDMPGASSVKDRVVALQQYFDPRYVLGPLYSSGEVP